MADCGVYKITCLPSGRIYIGSALRMMKRFGQHRRALNLGRHHSFLLQRAWSKHGADAFTFERVLFCASDHRRNYEKKLMDFYESADHAKGFNICRNANGGPPMSPEQRAASSKARKGKCSFKNNPEAYARFLATVKRGEDHPMFGRTHSPEVLARIGAAHRGKTPWNKGLPSAARGVARDDEAKANIRAAKRARGSITERIARELRDLHGLGGVSQRDLSRDTGIPYHIVTQVIRNISWVEAA